MPTVTRPIIRRLRNTQARELHSAAAGCMASMPHACGMHADRVCGLRAGPPGLAPESFWSGCALLG